MTHTKQLQKMTYHNGNLEAIKPAWNVITAMPPTNEDTTMWKLLTFSVYTNFKLGDQQTQIMWLARDCDIVRSEVLTAVLLKIQVFRDLTLCCLASSSKCFGGQQCL